jgi:hypothetical protein
VEIARVMPEVNVRVLFDDQPKKRISTIKSINQTLGCLGSGLEFLSRKFLHLK